MTSPADRSKPELSPPPKRRNAQTKHHGVAHAPDEFDVMNPAKMTPADPARLDGNQRDGGEAGAGADKPGSGGRGKGPA